MALVNDLKPASPGQVSDGVVVFGVPSWSPLNVNVTPTLESAAGAVVKRPVRLC